MIIDPDSYPLTTIEHTDKSTLRQLFETKFDVSTTSRSSQLLMRGNLSWALQAKQEKLASQKFQARLIKQLEKALAGQTPLHKPGTRLIREWHGKVYEVTILERGYHWQNKTYQSLSRIAQEITGARWSGPRFFGVR